MFVKPPVRLIPFFAVFLVLFSSFAIAGNFIDINVKHVVCPGGNITLEGHVYTNTSQGIQGVNVTGTASSDDNSDVTQSDGSFSFNLTAPSTTGDHNLTVTTNDSSIPNKTIPVYVSDVYSGSITHLGKKPPFSAGSTFTINVTMKNSSGQVVQSLLPEVEIFKTNGKNQTSWTVTNLSADSGSNGIIAFNVTVPSGASGQYAIVVERGAIFSIFEVSSGYIIAVSTETTDGEKSFNFYPGEGVMVLAKIRNTDGDPQTASSVKAFVTLPNNTVLTKTLSSHPTYTGYYNNSFTSTSATGEYKVRITANVSGTIVEGYTMFQIKPFSSKLTEEEDFFFEWGGKGSLKPGDVARLNVLLVNLTDGSIMTRGDEYADCSATYFDFLGIYHPNGTQVTGMQGNFVNGQHILDDVCSVNFTTPSESGIYGVKVNVTIGTSDTAEGYFAVQNYFLKAKPVNDLGGEKGFEVMIAPGENVTLSLSAYDISAESEVDSSLIQNIIVTKMKQLEFTIGVDEQDLTEDQDYWISGEGTQTPEVKVNVPSTVLGEVLIEVQANLSGETVIGNAFFIANYVDGFMMPVSGGKDGEGNGGEEEDMGGPPVSSCEGMVQFVGMLEEVKSGESAQGVSIKNIMEARNEFTGEEISSCLTIVNSTPSNSNGQITAYIDFSDSCSFTGFHFILLNVTYQGKMSGVPAGVFCKKLDFWPTISSLGSDEESWRIAPDSPVVLTIENVTRLNDSSLIDNRSYVVVPRLFNFNPSKGGDNILKNNTPLTFTFDSVGPYDNVTENNVSFILYPQNFTTKDNVQLTKWPSGFVDIEPSVCSPSIGGSCDTGFAGFEVVAFDMWPEDWGWSAQYSTGENVTMNISAKTNISSVGDFTVMMGRPWEGQMISAEVIGTAKLEDEWNDTNDTGKELWQINFTIPTTVSKGGQELIVTGNNTKAETTDMHLWTTIVKYKVNVPYEEGLQMDEHWIHVDNWNETPWPEDNTSDYGWNMTYLEEQYGLNSSIGRVCLKEQFNTTRYGQEQQTIVYDPNKKVLIMDNHTGDFDTIVVNDTTTGNISIITKDSRNFSIADGSGGLYLWELDDCGWARIVNSTAPNTQCPWGGQWQVNASFVVPLIVYKGTADSPSLIYNATLGVKSIAEQETGGFGFKEKLDESEYTWSEVQTNLNGFAFIPLTINNSGRQKVFWNLSYSNETDVATFETAVEAEVKVFRTWGERAYWLPEHLVTMAYTNNTQTVWEAFTNASETPWVYNGTIQESGDFDFIRDNLTTPTWYAVYNPYTNETVLDDDTNFTQCEPQFEDNEYSPIVTTGCTPPCAYYKWNESFEIDDSYTEDESIRLGVNAYRNNTLNTFYISFYQKEPRPQDWNIDVEDENENITVRVCAEGFEKPNPSIKEGALVKLKMMEWGMDLPVEKNLTMYDPINGSIVSTIQIGPTGCVVFNASNPDGWPDWCNSIQGTATYEGNIEDFFVTEVCYFNGGG